MSTSLTIRPVKPSGAGIVVELTDIPQLSGGVGGWEVLARPRDTPAAAWVGLPETTLTLPVILNGMEAGGPGSDISVEAQCQALVSWGLPTRATDEPPILSVAGLQRVGSGTRWVLQSLDEGPYITDDADQRIQAEFTITLLRHREASLVKGPARRARKRNKGKNKDGKGKNKGRQMEWGQDPEMEWGE